METLILVISDMICVMEMESTHGQMVGNTLANSMMTIEMVTVYTLGLILLDMKDHLLTANNMEWACTPFLVDPC